MEIHPSNMQRLNHEGPSIQVSFKLPYRCIEPISKLAREKEISFPMAARLFTLKGMKAEGIDV
jgi:hypothetical protein